MNTQTTVLLLLVILIIFFIAQVYINTKIGCEYIYKESNQNFSYNMSMLNYESWVFPCEMVLK